MGLTPDAISQRGRHIRNEPKRGLSRTPRACRIVALRSFLPSGRRRGQYSTPKLLTRAGCLHPGLYELTIERVFPLSHGIDSRSSPLSPRSPRNARLRACLARCRRVLASEREIPKRRADSSSDKSS